MGKVYKKISNQKDAYTSSWSFKEIVLLKLWHFTWILLYYPTPKFFNLWRVFLLNIFGAKINHKAFIYPSSKIFAPWLLRMDERACLGPNSEIYNLGPVSIGARSTVSQFSYVCNGTHDFANPNLPLMIGDIIIGDDVFIGAKSLILPGIKICNGSLVGAGSVVTKDVEPWTVVGGNPAKFLKKRIIKDLS